MNSGFSLKPIVEISADKQTIVKRRDENDDDEMPLLFFLLIKMRINKIAENVLAVKYS